MQKDEATLPLFLFRQNDPGALVFPSGRDNGIIAEGFELLDAVVSLRQPHALPRTINWFAPQTLLPMAQATTAPCSYLVRSTSDVADNASINLELIGKHRAACSYLKLPLLTGLKTVGRPTHIEYHVVRPEVTEDVPQRIPSYHCHTGR